LNILTKCFDDRFVFDIKGAKKAGYLDHEIAAHLVKRFANVRLFDVTPAHTYKPFLKYFIIGNLIIFLSFEIMRRMFYYIVLGTLRPKNNKLKG